MSHEVSKKTVVVLTIAFLAAVVLYNVAPAPLPSGVYQAELRITSPGLEVSETFEILFREAGEVSESTYTFNGSSTDVVVTLTHEVPLAPNTHMVFVIDASGDDLRAEQVTVRLTNMDTVNMTLRPTRQDGQTFHIEYQPLVNSRNATVILGVVGILWFTEGISLVATSVLIPIMIVLSNIQSPEAALAPFFDPAVALIFGGFLIGRALSKYELDRRLALMILSRSAGSGSSLILTVMGISAFLSMWISNTASAAIMIPIALAVISRIQSEDVRNKYGKALVLGVAYAATVGGVATLVGSPPNPLAATYINSFLGQDFSFINWIPYGLPVVVIMIPIIWQWLLFRFKLPKDIEEIRDLKEVSEKEYLKLGPMSTDQKLVVLIFASVVGLWLTEELPDIIANAIGWGGHGISSSVVALLGGLALLMLRLLDEKDVSSEISWSSLLILGSGIVLGGAIIDTGLSTYIAQQLGGLGTLPSIAVIVIIGIVAVLVTMVASNTGAAVILIPIAIPLATELGIDPLLITMVIAIAVSMDFALPTGTPPSTIAYSTGKVEMREMVSTGLIVDLIAVLIVTLLVVYLWAFLGLVTL
ncbi:DASS family sodium-coupled anion symporter [Candidatus Thorarchaeota archaeon]|nr:MAG: DASS family sodium-coupled anion symporter [Candidatus Thorarchaeota archaeon]